MDLIFNPLGSNSQDLVECKLADLESLSNRGIKFRTKGSS